MTRKFLFHFALVITVKFSLRGTYYGNNTLVRMEDIGENSEALICSTDLRPCCGSIPNRYGEWYYPNSSNVRTYNSGDTLYRNRLDDGTVRLHRRSGTTLPNANGRYKCTIPNQQGDDVDIVVTILNANGTEMLYCVIMLHVIEL